MHKLHGWKLWLLIGAGIYVAYLIYKNFNTAATGTGTGTTTDTTAAGGTIQPTTTPVSTGTGSISNTGTLSTSPFQPQALYANKRIAAFETSTGGIKIVSFGKGKKSQTTVIDA